MALPLPGALGLPGCTPPRRAPSFDFLVRILAGTAAVCVTPLLGEGLGSSFRSSGGVHPSALPALLSPGLPRLNQRPWCTVPAARGPSWTASS